MEPEHYSNIFNYLLQQQYPTNFISQQKQQLSKQSKNFNIKDNLLFKISPKKPRELLRVIQKDELPALMYMMHNDPTSEHFATEAMFNKIKTRYYWPQFYEDIRKYVA